MAKRRDLIEENVKILAEGLGPRLVPYMSLEDRLRGLTLEQRLQGLDIADIPLEDIVNRLSDEKRQVLRKLLDDHDNGS